MFGDVLSAVFNRLISNFKESFSEFLKIFPKITNLGAFCLFFSWELRKISYAFFRRFCAGVNCYVLKPIN
jgi:hypothetical protein